MLSDQRAPKRIGWMKIALLIMGAFATLWLLTKLVSGEVFDGMEEANATSFGACVGLPSVETR